MVLLQLAVSNIVHILDPASEKYDQERASTDETNDWNECGDEIQKTSHKTMSFNGSSLEASNVKCEKCQSNLGHDVYVSRGQKMCSNCAMSDKMRAENCKGCGQQISDSQFIKILYKKRPAGDVAMEVPESGYSCWHLECLKCCSCDALIGYWSSNLFEREFKFYCKNCYNSRFCINCNQCNSVIEDSPIKLEDKYFHSACFRCSEKSCFKKLSSLFQTQNGLAYCLECFNFYFGKRCSKCCTTIAIDVETGNVSYLTFNKRNYHLLCFKCEQPRCENVIDTRGFSLVDRKITCQSCVKNFYVQPNSNAVASEK